MHETGTFDATVDKLKTLESQARQEVAALGGNKLLEGLLDLLAKDYSH